jgi:hypothetical protein
MTAHSIKLICLACVLALTAAVVTGCCTKDNLGTAEDLEQARKEREWSDRISAGVKADKDAAGTPADGTVMKSEAPPEGEPVLIWKAGNDGAIEGMNGTAPTVSHDGTFFVTEICTYHSNGSGNSMGPAGTIALKAEDGTMYGPWQAELRSNVYWIVKPDREIPAGSYTVVDSNPVTWAQNSASNGEGMGWAYGIPVK